MTRKVVMMDVGKASEKMEDPHLRNKSPHKSDGMTLGITTDVVMTEIATLVKLKLAHVLKIELKDVGCFLGYQDNKVIPEITVDGDAAEGLEPSQIKEVIQAVWWGVKPELEMRLADLGSRRGNKEA